MDAIKQRSAQTQSISVSCDIIPLTLPRCPDMCDGIDEPKWRTFLNSIISIAHVLRGLAIAVQPSINASGQRKSAAARPAFPCRGRLPCRGSCWPAGDLPGDLARFRLVTDRGLLVLFS